MSKIAPLSVNNKNKRIVAMQNMNSQIIDIVANLQEMFGTEYSIDSVESKATFSRNGSSFSSQAVIRFFRKEPDNNKNPVAALVVPAGSIEYLVAASFGKDFANGSNPSLKGIVDRARAAYHIDYMPLF